jgi:hypothetical protein
MKSPSKELPVAEAEVLLQLERVLASPPFARSRRLSRFLQFAIELTLQGRADELKEYLIGTEVFDRGSDFDPRIDTIVRTQAHRLRAMLVAYYEKEGKFDPVWLELPRGSYAPLIRLRDSERPLPVEEPSTQRNWRWPVAIAGGVLALAAAVWGFWPRGTHAESLPAHLGLPLFAPGVLDVDRGAPVLSPRGGFVVFPLIEATGERRLWLRPLRSMSAMPLAGTEGGYLPFWSPDEAEIGFFADGMLKIFRRSEGAVRSLCEAPLGRGGTWGRDGTILFCPRTSGGSIHRVSAENGTPVPVTKLDAAATENGHRWPELLADGRHFVYSTRAGLRRNEGIFLASLDGGPPVRLASIQSQVHVASTSSGDFLLYVKDSSIRARRLNLATRRLEGAEVTMAENVQYTPAAGASFSVLGDRMLAYHTAPREETQPVQVDRAGKVLHEVLAPGNFEAITIDPSGRRLALDRRPPRGESDIWFGSLPEPALQRVTFDGGSFGVWSHDGSSLYFGNPGNGLLTLFSKRIQDAAVPRPVARFEHTLFPTDVSPDGRYLLAYEDHPETLMDLVLVPLMGEGSPKPLRNSRFNERHGFFSPDGRSIAYVSDESGQAEVYVEPLDESAGQNRRRWKVSGGGGSHPRWNPDGRELFYVSAKRALMSVRVSDPAGRPEFGVPVEMFPVRISSRGDFKSPYAVSPDGKSFYLLESRANSPQIQIYLLTSWAAFASPIP